MKLQPTSIKRIALLLSIVVLMQGCKLYTYQPSTIDDTVRSGFANKIKIVSDNGKTYRFDRIEKVNDNYYGFTKKESVTAKKLGQQIERTDEFGMVRILLNEDQKDNVYEKMYNKPLSDLVSILIPIGLIGVPLIILLSSGVFSPKIGGAIVIGM